MITGLDIYHVFTAVIPLYFAMSLAYLSVKYLKIFSPDQCSGINKFVALFAVPLLSFHFIPTNNPYAMNSHFIAADTLQKIMVLAFLFLCSKLCSRLSLERSITLFSLATLPNTLVMGIPLLQGMYGDASGTLMVQIVVLQCIVWYTLLMFLFEYGNARSLLSQQFPDTAGSIVSIKVDSDIVSLNETEPLETQVEFWEDGKLHVRVRKSSSSSTSAVFSKHSRFSNFSNVEIYSVPTSRVQTPRGSSFNHTDFYSFANGRSGVTPRNSNFGNIVTDEENGGGVQYVMRGGVQSGVGGGYPGPPVAEIRSPVAGPTGAGGKKMCGGSVGKDHMFAWSSSASPEAHNGSLPHAKDYEDYGRDGFFSQNKTVESMPEVGSLTLSKLRSSSTTELRPKASNQGEAKPTAKPPIRVMTRLILRIVWRKLIRNPNTYSSLFGLAWSLIAFRWHVAMPAIIANSIKILADAGLGMAMFSLGLFMALQPSLIACGYSEAAMAVAIRFIVGPIAMAVPSLAFGLRGSLLHIAIVQAALPQGIVPFVFAKEYNVHPEILSTAVIFGMVIALPFTLGYYLVLG